MVKRFCDEKENPQAALPPRAGAKIWQHGKTKAARHLRDENLRKIRRVGKKKWKEERGYHQQSLAERLSIQSDLR